MGEDKKTLKELIAGGGRHIGAALAGLLTYPIIARVLDDDGLGAWALLGAASFLLSLTDLGLTTSVQRAAVTDDQPRARRLVALSLAVVAATVPVVGVLAYFFLIDLPADTSPELVVDSRRAAVVALVAGGVMAFTGPYRGFVYARGGIRHVANARTAASVLQVLAIIVGFPFLRSLLVPAGALLLAYLVELLMTVRAARLIDPDVPLLPRLPPDRKEARTAFRDGAAQLAVNLSVVTALRVDLFVLVRVAPLAVVAAYGVAGRAVDMSYLLAKQATVALMPRLGDPNRRARAVRIGTGVFSGVIFSGMAALALDGQPLLVAWVGDVVSGETPALVLTLLAIAAVIMSTYEVTSSMVMLSAPSGWSCAVPIVIGSIVNLVISVALAPHYGIWAVAGSTIVGNTLTFLLIWATARSLLSWRFSEVLVALSPGLAAGVAAGGVGFALHAFAHTGLSGALIGCTVTGLFGIGAAALVLKLTTQQDAGDSV
jgi:O-antigen/teichoic acid export membrane protein